MYDNETLMTDLKVPQGKLAQVSFTEQFVFTVPSKLQLGLLQFILYEPGLGISHQMAQTGPYYKWYCCPLRFGLKLATCPIKWCLCFPCTLTYKILKTAGFVTAKGTDATAGAIGATAKVAESSKISLTRFFSLSDVARFNVEMKHVDNKKGGCLKDFFRKRTYASLSVQVKYIKPPNGMFQESDTTNQCSPISQPMQGKTSSFSSQVDIVSRKKKVQYECVSGQELLHREGLPGVFKLVRDCYDRDVLGPRGHSALEAPPVKRVTAIYGVNLPTEVGAIYRRANILKECHKIQKLHILDTTAKLKKGASNYKITSGIILETKDTPQNIYHGPTTKQQFSEVVHRSGDGTVPYWSLQHCRTWEGSCNVIVHELEGSEHREILADARFHKILIDHVMNQSS